MFNLKQRRQEREEHQRSQAKIGHISRQLQAANNVLSEKDLIIKSLKNDISMIKASTAEIKNNLITMQGELVKTRAKVADSEERTTAKAVELAASAGHQPKHINQ